jgi:hypothetical protein
MTSIGYQIGWANSTTTDLIEIRIKTLLPTGFVVTNSMAYLSSIIHLDCRYLAINSAYSTDFYFDHGSYAIQQTTSFSIYPLYTGP